jgi:redox-sensing transcriptional repressor
LQNNEVSRATLGRIPIYLKYLKRLPPEVRNISATTIAKELGLGEVQVRKDLGTLCGSGKPKIGYFREELYKSLESFLDCKNGGTIIIGAGRLGRALLDYEGFEVFGLKIIAAFDKKQQEADVSPRGKPILPMLALPSFCKENDVKIGIIAVPAESAQEVCNVFYENGIKAMWCFAPCQLYKPADAVIQYENMALSLAHLKMLIKK